jgi:hypothetical protein
MIDFFTHLLVHAKIYKMKVSEIKRAMNGCEVISLTYEGCVSVINGQAYSYGKKIQVNWKTLWREYLEGEGFL